MQLPFNEQGCGAPMLADSQETEEVALKFNTPSPRFEASTDCAGPFCPGTIETVSAVVVRPSRGAALSSDVKVSKRTKPQYEMQRFLRITRTPLVWKCRRRVGRGIVGKSAGTFRSTRKFQIRRTNAAHKRSVLPQSLGRF